MPPNQPAQHDHFSSKNRDSNSPREIRQLADIQEDMALITRKAPPTPPNYVQVSDKGFSVSWLKNIYQIAGIRGLPGGAMPRPIKTRFSVPI